MPMSLPPMPPLLPVPYRFNRKTYGGHGSGFGPGVGAAGGVLEGTSAINDCPGTKPIAAAVCV